MIDMNPILSDQTSLITTIMTTTAITITITIVIIPHHCVGRRKKVRCEQFCGVEWILMSTL
jgi:hypothetical protein